MTPPDVRIDLNTTPAIQQALGSLGIDAGPSTTRWARDEDATAAFRATRTPPMAPGGRPAPHGAEGGRER